MPAIVAKTRAIQNNLEQARFRRAQKTKIKKIVKNRLESGFYELRRKENLRFQVARPDKSSKEFRGDTFLEIPSKLDLITNFDDTAELVREIRKAALSQRRRVRLIFDNADTIQPTALILLLAEIHRCRLLYGHDRVSGNYPKNPRLERMLADTGFFDLLGVKPRKVSPERKYPLQYIKFRSQNKLDSAEPKKLRTDLLGEHITMHPKVRSRLYRALTEAMINVGQHAYPDHAIKSHAAKGRWWIAGHVNRRSKEMMITFCDLGVGIAETLPKIYPWEMIRSALSVLPGVKPNDGQMIEAAMKIGRSRTGQSNRGRGLNDLRSLIDQAGAGELYIFSRRGRYRYSAGGGESVENGSLSVGGTIIKWSVPLERITDWISEDSNEEVNHD